MNFQNRVRAALALPFTALEMVFLTLAAIVGGLLNAIFAASDSIGDTYQELSAQLRSNGRLFKQIALEAFGRNG